MFLNTEMGSLKCFSMIKGNKIKTNKHQSKMLIIFQFSSNNKNSYHENG